MKELIIKILVFLMILHSVLSKSNYSLDGSYNHPTNWQWGKSGTKIIRIVTPKYDDNNSIPYGGYPSKLPSTRYISNMLFGREAAGCRPHNDRLVTDLLTYWGQFVDHDLSLSPDTSSTGCVDFKIPIPSGDYFYDKLGIGNKTMNFCRTVTFEGSGTNGTNIREIPNVVTSWFDASMVYGSDYKFAAALRTSGGKMKTSYGPDGPLLPANDDGQGNILVNMGNDAKRVPSNTLFAGGDVRANENPVLTSLTALFVREHNRRVDLLKENLSDEEKYQEARRLVIAHIQAITFNEFLPCLFNTKIPPYQFNSNLNPQISAFFSTVAFRFGHDLLSGILPRYDKDGLPIKDGHILLRDSYSFPFAVRSVGIGPYLRGAAVSQQSSPDAMLEEDVRTFLFDQSAALATDLAARNMQRARDHGIPSYNECRKAYSLPTCETFSCVNNNNEIIGLLNQAYGIDNVTYLDPYLGGLLETKLPGSNLGQLFTTAIIEQLTRTRDADRYWYENEGILSKEELVEIENTKLSDILKRNIETNTIPKDVFNMRDISPRDALSSPSEVKIGQDDTKWIISVTVLGSFATFLIFVVLILLFFLIKTKRTTTNKSDNKMTTVK